MGRGAIHFKNTLEHLRGALQRHGRSLWPAAARSPQAAILRLDGDRPMCLAAHMANDVTIEDCAADIRQLWDLPGEGSGQLRRGPLQIVHCAGKAWFECAPQTSVLVPIASCHLFRLFTLVAASAVFWRKVSASFWRKVRRKAFRLEPDIQRPQELQISVQASPSLPN